MPLIRSFLDVCGAYKDEATNGTMKPFTAFSGYVLYFRIKLGALCTYCAQAYIKTAFFV